MANYQNICKNFYNIKYKINLDYFKYEDKIYDNDYILGLSMLITELMNDIHSYDINMLDNLKKLIICLSSDNVSYDGKIEDLKEYMLTILYIAKSNIQEDISVIDYYERGLSNKSMIDLISNDKYTLDQRIENDMNLINYIVDGIEYDNKDELLTLISLKRFVCKNKLDFDREELARIKAILPSFNEKKIKRL